MNFDGTLKSASRLTGLNCLWAWYPFKKECKILIAGSDYENDTDILKKRTEHLDEYKDIPKNTDVRYDYIILSDYGVSDFKNKADYYNMVFGLKRLLIPNGRFLMAVNNRFGVKYLCGEPDETTGVPFDNISDNNGAYRFSGNELKKFLMEAGFEKIKFYYPLPDCFTPQLVYTDDYRPSSELCERLNIYIKNSGSRILNEESLFHYMAENDELLSHANSFIVECGCDVSDIMYCSMTPGRSKENAFVTVIHEKTVEKIPMYGEGIKSLEKIYKNHSELKKRNVPVLDIEIENDSVVMRKVNAISLSKYMRSLDRENLVKCIEKIYEYILRSSEHISPDKNKMLFYDKTADWGTILETAYIEMLPVNCFYENDGFLFFDQEYTIPNCPAKYVLFRTLNDIYRLTPEIENILPFAEAKEHFGIAGLWDYFQKEEAGFWADKSNPGNKSCRNFLRSLRFKNSDYSIKQNRKALQMNNQSKQTESSTDVMMFDSVGGLDSRKIILFGAGKMAGYFMDKYKDTHKPEFIIDNDPNKWGQEKYGLKIYSPDKLNEINIVEHRIIITAGYGKIADQLEQLGISEKDYRAYNYCVDDLIPAAISDTISFGKYNIGYVTGAFDLFHIGHLNLLKNCKNRCHYLIAGVLTDDIVRNEKHKDPFISFDERIEIVKQCKYVDRAVPIDKHNTNKIDAWKELRYGCLFSGGDHEKELYWIWLKKQLNTLGAELEFFPYTQSTSSTMLQKVIREKIGE